MTSFLLSWIFLNLGEKMGGNNLGMPMTTHVFANPKAIRFSFRLELTMVNKEFGVLEIQSKM